MHKIKSEFTPGTPLSPSGPPFDLDAIADGLADAVSRAVEVRGTFSAANAALLGLIHGGTDDAAQRTAHATEQVARHTKRLEQYARTGGLTFG